MHPGDRVLINCPHVKEIHGKIVKIFDIEKFCVIIKGDIDGREVEYVIPKAGRFITPIKKRSG